MKIRKPMQKRIPAIRSARTSAAAAAILWILWPALAGPAAAQELRLVRVMLSAGGVGYFEYEASVAGDAALPLSVRLDQVDDVLKSIVVYDDEGQAGTIRLPGREPLAQLFRDLPFGPEALTSPVALLNSLVGAEIRVTGPRLIEGRLVRVVAEAMALPDRGGTVTRNRVSVMTSAGLQTFLFEDAEAVEFTDRDLQAQIDAALAAVAAHRTRERRTLEVVSRGDGRRTVRVGYVVAAPLWKATYRLTLPEDGGRQGRLQGWAVIENMSGREWRDVELTIVSGNPVTFRQALYAAYYAQRPEVPVEVLGRVLPRPDTGTMAIDELGVSGAEYEQEFRKRQRAEVGSEEYMVDLNSGVQARPDGKLYVRGGRSGEVSMMTPAAAPPPAQARLLAATSQEAATQVTFRIPHAVSVASGQSVLVPIIDRDIPSEPVGLYQMTTHDRHPLHSVRLDNDGETGLPAGVITLYGAGKAGTSFLGDAQLSTLPVGDERLVSFALDQETTIDREVESAQSIAEGHVADGVLELKYEDEETTVYRLKAPQDESRELLVEHSRREGWQIVEPDPEDVELADDHYRIRREVGAGKQTKLTVRMTKPRFETVALVDQTEDVYLGYAQNGELSDELRDAFAELARLRRDVAARERRVGELEEQRRLIHEEQGRIRENLYRVPGGSDLHARYMAKLTAQEDNLDAILADLEVARAELAAAQQALAAYLRNLEN